MKKSAENSALAFMQALPNIGNACIYDILDSFKLGNINQNPPPLRPPPPKPPPDENPPPKPPPLLMLDEAFI